MSITAIPGRRISSGDSFFTDWVSRGGDCMLVRAELIAEDGGGSASVVITVDTREEPGVGLASNVSPTVPSSAP